LVHDPPVRGFRGVGPGGGGQPAPPAPGQRGNRGNDPAPPAPSAQRGGVANARNFQQPQRGGGRGQAPPPDEEERDIAPTPMGGLTPLLYAARQGNVDAVRALLDAGANVNEVSSGDKT